MTCARPRKAVLTMGTSLFHSATWVCAGDLETTDYGRWLKKPSYRLQPKQRETDLAAAPVAQQVREGPLETWIDRLPDELVRGEPNPSEAMRYSAELATLIRLAESEGQSLGDLLETFETLDVVAEKDLQETPESDHGLHPARSHRAGEHLVAYLNHLLEHRNKPPTARLHAISGLSSTRARELKGALEALADHVRHLADRTRELELVVTGGYKVYGYFLIPLAIDHSLNASTTLHYIHEQGDDLVRISRGGLWIGTVQVSDRYGPGVD